MQRVCPVKESKPPHFREKRSDRRRMDIQERTFQFAVRVVRLVDRLPRTIAGMGVGRQPVRAATSVGADVVEEADAAESKGGQLWNRTA